MKVQVYKTLQGLRRVLEAYTQLQATPRDIQDYFVDSCLKDALAHFCDAIFKVTFRQVRLALVAES